jgi:hypothetical protein
MKPEAAAKHEDVEADKRSEINHTGDGCMECYGTTTDFLVFLHHVGMIFDKLKTDDEVSEHTKIWNKWISSGLTITTTFQEMKSITSFEGLYEFFYFLNSSSEVIKILDIQWDDKILYRLTTNKNNDTTPEQASSNASSETYFDGDEAKADLITIVSPVTPVKNKEGSQKQAEDIIQAGLFIPQVDEMITMEEWDLMEAKELESYTIDTINLDSCFGFIIFHSYIYDIINKWRMSKAQTQLTLRWRKWLFKGLTRDKDFKAVKKILEINTLNEYLKLMQQYPITKERITWEWQGERLKYWIIPEDIPEAEDNSKNPAKLIALRSDLQLFSHKFDLSIKDVNNRLKDSLFRLDILDERSRRHERGIERNAQQQGQRLMQEHCDTMKRITDNLLADHRIAIAAIAKESIDTFKSAARAVITTFDTEMARKVETFKQHLDSLSISSVAASQEKLGTTQIQLINELQEAATEISHTIRNLAETRIGDLQTGEPALHETNKQGSPAKVHPLFPNVDPTLFNSFNPPTNPYRDPKVDENKTSLYPPRLKSDESADLSPSDERKQPEITTPVDIRDPTASPQRLMPAAIPQGNPQPFQQAAMHPTVQNHYGAQYQTPAIPYLQYENIIKRAQVQYTGEQDVLVFYNQLRNGVAHYGLYLIETIEFAFEKSLCPPTYNGYQIDDERYKLMAGCLYQKLASFETIPAEFSSARTVINRYAEANDGYKVLYNLIEHLLHNADVLTPPTGDEWPDIHEYAIKFQSWTKREALKGRHFAPKELTQQFLQGLNPAYQPAIKRARNLLDGSSPADPTVPTVLKIANLPKTLERWIKEETGQSVIRTTHGTNYLHTALDRLLQEETGMSVARPAYGTPKRFTNPKEQGERFTNQANIAPFKNKGNIYADKKCHICLGTGHPKTQCLAFARYLMCRDADQRADDSLRTKVLDFFKEEAKRKSERGRKRAQLGIVRQMWTEGRPFDEIEHALLDSTSDDHFHNDSSDSDTDE